MKLTQRMTRRTLPWVAFLTLGLTLGACGKKQSDDDDEEDDAAVPTSPGGGTTVGTIAADRPGDSTGQSAALSLNFGTDGTALALQAVTSLDVGGGVTLTDARISIGSIKIKANKETGGDERALKDELKAEKKSREAALEADKKLLEDKKEAVKKKYEPQFESASTEAEKDALKVQMIAEVALVEKDLATLEATKEEEMAALEAQRDGNVKWKGPYVYDLIAGGITPALPEVSLVDGSYRRIEFKVKPNRTLEGTDPLLNNSIYLEGTVNLAGTPTPFAASFRVDEEFKLMGAGAFKVDPSVANAMTVVFNPASWFTGVDFTGAIVDATGVISVTDVVNPGIWELIRKNVKTSTRFGKDEDNDGKLGTEEESGDGVEGEAEAEAESI